MGTPTAKSAKPKSKKAPAAKARGRRLSPQEKVRMAEIFTRFEAAEPDPRIGRYIWSRASNNYCWSAFLAGTPAEDHATIAGLAPDVVGLPPTFLAVGELDLFVHDNLAYVRRLLAAGCSVEAHLSPGAFHGFDRMVEAPVSMRYSRDLVDFILHHLG